MKKLNLLLVTMLLLFLGTGTAFALPFHWDLNTVSATGTGTPTASSTGTAVDFPLDMTTSGRSTITQSFIGGANDAILDSGDIFTEFGMLSVLGSGGWPTPTGEAAFVLGNGLNAYIYWSGLSGEIANYNDGGTVTTNAATFQDDSFSLNFYAGVGDIKVYIDNDFNPNNAGTIEVAELELLYGLGTSPFPIAGFAEGQFGLIAQFTSVLDNFWYTNLFGLPGEDFYDIVNDPNRGILAASFNLGATLFSTPEDVTGGIKTVVVNEGSFLLSVVPEPTTMILFGFGLLGLAGITRKKVS